MERNPRPVERTWASRLGRFSRLAIVITALVFIASAARAGDLEKTQTLITVLQSEAGLFEKARACQQLGEIGTKEAVPALAALLDDEKLAAYARSGLEGIPDPSAAAALRGALGRVQGDRLVGVVNSLGVLRDAQAVAALIRLVGTSGSGVGQSALLALGRIANEPAVRFLNKTLKAGSGPLREAAAAACLLAAERQLAGGKRTGARSLYDAVRQTPVSVSLRIAATRGAILTRRPNAVPFLMTQLKSEDRAVRGAALLTIREMPGETLANALNAELGKANAEAQIHLIGALVDCHNLRSLEGIRALLESPNPGVRIAALTALGTIGGPVDAKALLRMLNRIPTVEESALIYAGLTRIQGAEVDRLILDEMESTEDAERRIRLMRLVGERGAEGAAEALLGLAEGPEAKVSRVAFQVLASLAQPRDLPALIRLTLACKDDAAGDAAEAAVVATALRIEDPTAQATLLLEALPAARESADRCSVLRMLAGVGGVKAFEAIAPSLQHPDERVRETAFSSLVEWPDPGAAELLLELAEKETSQKRRTLALRGATRLAGVAASNPVFPAEQALAWLTRANQAARTVEEKRLILSALANVKRIESFRLLLPYLDDPELMSEAGAALIQLTPSLLAANHGEAVREALKKVVATGKSQDLREKARRLLESIPPTVNLEAPTDAQRIKAGAVVQPGRVRLGERVTLAVRVRLAPGFHVYAMEEAGSADRRTEIAVTAPDLLEPQGDWQGPAPRVKDDGSRTFAGDVLFRRQFSVSGKAPAGRHKVAVGLDVQVCNEALCWPPETISLACDLEVLASAR